MPIGRSEVEVPKGDPMGWSNRKFPSPPAPLGDKDELSSKDFDVRHANTDRNAGPSHADYPDLDLLEEFAKPPCDGTKMPVGYPVANTVEDEDTGIDLGIGGKAPSAPDAPPLSRDDFYVWLDKKEALLWEIHKLRIELGGLLDQAQALLGELRGVPERRDQIWIELQPILNSIAVIRHRMVELG